MAGEKLKIIQKTVNFGHVVVVMEFDITQESKDAALDEYTSVFRNAARDIKGRFDAYRQLQKTIEGAAINGELDALMSKFDSYIFAVKVKLKHLTFLQHRYGEALAISSETFAQIYAHVADVEKEVHPCLLSYVTLSLITDCENKFAGLLPRL